VKGKIADYKVPERVLFLPSLPKGLTGKVQRRALGDLMV
jgi:acyl-coenzyme A synthetase/AMP-(fatty) acid ligase